jgi:hypothetical protein
LLGGRARRTAMRTCGVDASDGDPRLESGGESNRRIRRWGPAADASLSGLCRIDMVPRRPVLRSDADGQPDGGGGPVQTAVVNRAPRGWLGHEGARGEEEGRPRVRGNTTAVPAGRRIWVRAWGSCRQSWSRSSSEVVSLTTDQWCGLAMSFVATRRETRCTATTPIDYDDDATPVLIGRVPGVRLNLIHARGRRGRSGCRA